MQVKVDFLRVKKLHSVCDFTSTYPTDQSASTDKMSVSSWRSFSAFDCEFERKAGGSSCQFSVVSGPFGSELSSPLSIVFSTAVTESSLLKQKLSCEGTAVGDVINYIFHSLVLFFYVKL